MAEKMNAKQRKRCSNWTLITSIVTIITTLAVPMSCLVSPTVVQVQAVEEILAVVLFSVDLLTYRARHALKHRYCIEKHFPITIRHGSNLSANVLDHHGEMVLRDDLFFGVLWYSFVL